MRIQMIWSALILVVLLFSGAGCRTAESAATAVDLLSPATRSAVFPLGGRDNITGAHQMALVFLQLPFEALEEGEGIGGGAGEAGQDLAVIEAADLLGVAFHDGVAEGNLAVAAHDDFAVAAH